MSASSAARWFVLLGAGLATAEPEAVPTAGATRGTAMGDTETLLRCRLKDSMSRSAGISTVVGEATLAGAAAGVRSRGLDTDKPRSEA